MSNEQVTQRLAATCASITDSLTPAVERFHAAAEAARLQAQEQAQTERARRSGTMPAVRDPQRAAK